MRCATVLAMCLALGACAPSSEGGVETGPAGTVGQLDPAQRRTAQLSPRWLVGYWDHQRNCGSGAGTTLLLDGTYTMNDASGRWSLSGDVLTIVERRPPSVQIFQARLGDRDRSRLRIIGPDTLFVQWPAGAADTFFRCTPR